MLRLAGGRAGEAPGPLEFPVGVHQREAAVDDAGLMMPRSEAD